MVLTEPNTEVSPDLRARLFDAIRSNLSPRYVPDEVIGIPEVPRTLSGKKMEVPVRKILLGQPPDGVASRDAMANPSSLDWFVSFAAAREQARDS